jgi:tetratricopeptide (TPR) repeat protein
MTLNKTATELKKIGMGYLDNQKYHKAIHFLSQAIDLCNDDAESYDSRSIAFYNLLQMENAIADLNKAIEIDPEYFIAHGHLGEIAYKKQEWEQVILHYSNALAHNSSSITYLSYVALANFNLKKYEEAKMFCESVLKLVPEQEWAMSLMSNIFIDCKMYDDALKWTLRLVELYPDTPRFYLNLGYIYLEMGELKLARRNFEFAIHDSPEYSYSYNNLGYIYFKEKNYTEALRLVNHSLSMDASNPFAYRNRALIRMANRENELAKQDLLTAQALGFKEMYGDQVEELIAQLS